jgi:hypothetical protein
MVVELFIVIGYVEFIDWFQETKGHKKSRKFPAVMKVPLRILSPRRSALA